MKYIVILTFLKINSKQYTINFSFPIDLNKVLCKLNLFKLTVNNTSLISHFIHVPTLKELNLYNQNFRQDGSRDKEN